jgi:hypothetical protein
MERVCPVGEVVGAERLNETMGDWLGKLAPWDVFSTWTFSRPVTLSGAMYWGRRHIRWLEKAAGQPIYAFVGAERGDRGGLLHLHGLVGNVGHLKPYCGIRQDPGTWGLKCCMLHAWPAGIARVLPYDPARGAAYYVGRYISKRLAEWQLFGFPAVPQHFLVDIVRPVVLP